MIVKLDELREKVLSGVEKLGYQGEDAQIISDVLIYAQTRGNNQGITKVATGGVPKFEDTEPFKLVRENKCGVLFSGGQSMVSTVNAADTAVELAKNHAVGIAAVNHTHTSSGAIGYYARRVASKGYICLVAVGNGDWAAVAPLGSAETKLGTNPIAHAFPDDGGQVVFDNATAGISY